jgi:hypothetical protein
VAHELPAVNNEMQLLHSSRAGYAQLCADLRATVFGELARNNTLKDGNGWAYYVSSVDDPQSPSYVDGRLEVLLLAVARQDAKRHINGRPVSDLHIITNEEIVSANGTQSWLTADFTLDNENDAQYYLDCAQDERVGQGTLLVVDEDGLALQSTHAAYWPAYFPPNAELIAAEDTLYPLGNYAFEEDRIDALTFARDVLLTIKGALPQNTGYHYTAET